LPLAFSYIPDDSQSAQAVTDLQQWFSEGKSWTESRDVTLHHFGQENFTDAPQNIAFTILGWLYVEDFGDTILKVGNCGYDTDCTAATLGAILGIIFIA
jgi:ADP-ribosylglycohydrolase